MKPLALVSQAARSTHAATERRDAVIVAAHDQGESIRAIAKAAGLSPARVHQILHGR